MNPVVSVHPCREGTGWLAKILKKVCCGEGSMGDWSLIQKISENMMGRTICALSDAAAMPAISFVTKFREEFEQSLYGENVMVTQKREGERVSFKDK